MTKVSNITNVWSTEKPFIISYINVSISNACPFLLHIAKAIVCKNSAAAQRPYTLWYEHTIIISKGTLLYCTVIYLCNT